MKRVALAVICLVTIALLPACKHFACLHHHADHAGHEHHADHDHKGGSK